MRGFDLLLGPVARFDQRLPFGFERIAFLRQAGQDRFAAQERIIGRGGASAENDSLRGNKLAAERGVLKMPGALLEFERGGQIGHDHHIAQEAPNDWRQSLRRVDLVDRPGHCALRQI